MPQCREVIEYFALEFFGAEGRKTGTERIPNVVEMKVEESAKSARLPFETLTPLVPDHEAFSLAKTIVQTIESILDLTVRQTFDRHRPASFAVRQILT
jgi:hypothetical protein